MLYDLQFQIVVRSQLTYPFFSSVILMTKWSISRERANILARERKYFVLLLLLTQLLKPDFIFTEPDKFLFFDALFQGESLLDGA